MSLTLDAYFEAMTRLLKHEDTPEAFLERVGGEGPPGRGLRYYQSAMQIIPGNILREVYGRCAAYADRVEPGLFDELVRHHFQLCPISRWQIFRLAESFADSVESYAAEREAQNRPIPTALVELVDYEQCLWLARSGAPAPTHGIAAPVFIMRRYTYAVRDWLNALRKDPATAEPRAEEQIWVIYRDPHEERAHVLRPTPAQLLALAVATGDLTDEQALGAGLTPDDLAAARASLRERGLLERA